MKKLNKKKAILTAIIALPVTVLAVILPKVIKNKKGKRYACR